MELGYHFATSRRIVGALEVVADSRWSGADIMARGLDIPECDAVFNLELPSDAAHYAHRAGRTGRLDRWVAFPHPPQ